VRGEMAVGLARCRGFSRTSDVCRPGLSRTSSGDLVWGGVVVGGGRSSSSCSCFLLLVLLRVLLLVLLLVLLVVVLLLLLLRVVAVFVFLFAAFGPDFAKSKLMMASFGQLPILTPLTW